MARGNFVQTSFLGGLWTKYAQGGMDDPLYKKALAVCLNGLSIEEGAWVRRSGTQLGGHTRFGAPARLQRFTFKASAPYNIEFTNGYVRAWKGADLVTDDSSVVSTISTATPAVVTINDSKTWTTGTQVYFTFNNAASAAALKYLANRQFQINRTDALHYSLFDGITSAAIDGALVAFLAGSSITMHRIHEVPSLYDNTEWPNVRAVQSDLQLLLLQAATKPQALVATPATPYTTFVLEQPTFVDGPYLDPPTDSSTLTPSGTTGTITLTASAITSINEGQGFLSTDVGRIVRLYSQPSAWDGGATYSQGDNVLFQGVAYYALYNSVGTNVGKRPDQQPTFWSTSPTLSTWTWGTITVVTNTTHVDVLLSGVPLPTTNAMTIWRLGVYSDTTGYPTCGCFHEGRVWLAGAVPNRVDACYSNGIVRGRSINFAPTDQFGAVSDANGISYTFNSSETNTILWLEPGGSGIVAGTEGQEWLLSAPSQGAMSPTNIKAAAGTAYGCANIEPKRAGLSMVFVQKNQRKLLEYIADAFTSKFYGSNLSAKAKAATKSGVQELAFQEELAPIMWMRLGDGTFAGATYRRTSNFSTSPPEFNAWHTHALGSERIVEYISAGPAQIEAGTIDTLAMITNDADTDIRYVELMRPTFDEEDLLTSAWFVDCGVVPSVGLTTSGGDAVTFYGLHLLEGKSVAAFIGGLDCGDYTVANAAITVPYGSAGGLFTAAYLSGLSTSGVDFGNMACAIDSGAMTVPALVGFNFTSQGQLLRPIAPADTGAQTGPAFAKLKRAAQIGVLLKNAVQGMKFGTSFSRMRLSDFRNTGKTRKLTVSEFFEGVYKHTLEDPNSFDSQFCWQIDRPHPCTITAAGNFEETEDV